MLNVHRNTSYTQLVIGFDSLCAALPTRGEGCAPTRPSACVSMAACDSRTDAMAAAFVTRPMRGVEGAESEGGGCGGVEVGRGRTLSSSTRSWGSCGA